MEPHEIEPRFAMFPSHLAERSRTLELAGVPTLLAHPDWQKPAPVMFWMHGRTVTKELDPGRYLRWIRAGIAAVSVDLPGHGQRQGPKLHGPDTTPGVLEQMLGEIDGVLEALGQSEHGRYFDLTRIGIGGMSAGGMVTLRRLCDEHPFRCAAVESTTGWLGELYDPEETRGRPWPAAHDKEQVARLDPMRHLDSFRPIPLLALHSEADEIVPIEGMNRFVEALRGHYTDQGADAGQIELKTWATTGAPSEHAGFGKVASEAKALQVEFLTEHLL